MVIGIVVGFWVAIRQERKRSDELFQIKQSQVLKDLKKSLEDNLNYLNQITEKHFKNGEFPTFPLDTAFLYYVCTNVREFLPIEENLGTRYNRLRFELEHINQKLDILRNYWIASLPIIECPRLCDGKDDVWRKNIEERGHQLFVSAYKHIEEAKKWTSEEIGILEKKKVA